MKFNIASAAAISLLFVTGALAAPITFTDVPPGAWFAASIQQAVDAGIASGYKDSKGNTTRMFGPADSVTAAEAYKMTAEAAGYQKGTDESLREAGIEGCTHWVCPYLTINLQGDFGIPADFSVVFGLGDQRTFDRPITREEMAAMVGSAFRIDWSNPMTKAEFPPNPYSDVPDLVEHVTPDPTVLSILRMTDAGILSGDTDGSGRPTGTFRPTDSLNRAEAVKIILGAMNAYGKVGLQPAPEIPMACIQEGVLTNVMPENSCCSGLSWIPQGNAGMGICQKTVPGENCIEKGGIVNLSIPPQDGVPRFCCPDLEPVLRSDCQGVGCNSTCE